MLVAVLSLWWPNQNSTHSLQVHEVMSGAIHLVAILEVASKHTSALQVTTHRIAELEISGNIVHHLLLVHKSGRLVLPPIT